MLCIGPDLAPQDRAGVVIDRLALAGNALAVAFHLELLEVARQMTQAAVVRQDRMRADIEKIDIPDADHRQHDRQVLLEGFVAKVVVHRVCAGKHASEIRHADFERNRQPDRRPHRVTPADPVPQLQPAIGRDAPGGHLVGSGRDADEMPPIQHFVLSAAGLAQPL